MSGADVHCNIPGAAVIVTIEFSSTSIPYEPDYGITNVFIGKNLPEAEALTCTYFKVESMAEVKRKAMVDVWEDDAEQTT